MPEALPASELALDLSGEAGRVLRLYRYQRALFLGVAGVFLALAGLTLAPGGHLTTGIRWLLAGMCLVVGGLLIAVALQRHSAPLSEARFEARTLRCRYADGTESLCDWSDPGFGLVLFDYITDQGSTASEKEHVWLVGPGERNGSVPRGLAQAIRDAAARFGVPVLVREEVVQGGKITHTPLVTRIGRPEATPGWKNAIAVRVRHEREETS